MIESDISKLHSAARDRTLDRLEADIWAGVAQRLEANRISRRVLTCQMALMVGALLFIIAAGNRIGQSVAEQGSPQGTFASGMDLAPSTLLLGHQT